LYYKTYFYHYIFEYALCKKGFILKFVSLINQILTDFEGNDFDILAKILLFTLNLKTL